MVQLCGQGSQSDHSLWRRKKPAALLASCTWSLKQISSSPLLAPTEDRRERRWRGPTDVSHQLARLLQRCCLESKLTILRSLDAQWLAWCGRRVTAASADQKPALTHVKLGGLYHVKGSGLTRNPRLLVLVLPGLLFSSLCASCLLNGMHAA